MKILSIIPPMTQLNTPYPSTAYITGFLRSRSTSELPIQAVQADASIELIHKLFSTAGLKRLKAALESDHAKPLSESVRFFLKNSDTVIAAGDAVLSFLSGRDPSFAARIITRKFLPEGPKFKEALANLESNGYLDFAFGSIGAQDRAKYFATLFLSDLAEVVRQGIDARFELSRYAEKIAASQRNFNVLSAAVEALPTLLDEMLAEITHEKMREHQPDLVVLTVPFPGNLYAALRIAKTIRSEYPKVKIVLGGGYVNTELRSLSAPEVFNYVDFITLDDGEKPLELLVQYLSGKITRDKLLRTFVRSAGSDGRAFVEMVSDKGAHDVPMKDAGIPTYDGLPLEKYLSVLEMLNPMHRLWSDARWNKVTLAHGCYWKKCSFCDVSLDYIGRYDPVSADVVVDRMTSLISETGQSGFHFVDEACPPALLKNLSQRLIERSVTASWWGNLRFDKAFTPEVAQLMARAGCIAVTGGLEVASDRLLSLMNKGVTIEQVAQVTKAFNDAGILVHAYLMYGFPSQTTQDTVDALEVVRQLFAAGCIDSAYWHRFSATIHSPVGKDPASFGIKLLTKEPHDGERIFAMNDLEFDDPTPADHDMLGVGLRKALYNFMHGIGLEDDVRVWFDQKVPKTTVQGSRISRALNQVQAKIT